MNINKIYSTPAFKARQEKPVEYIEANFTECEDSTPIKSYVENDYVEISEYKEPENNLTVIDTPKKPKKTPEEKIMDLVKAATVSGIAIPTGLKAGEKLTGKLEVLVKQFCADFSDDAARAVTDGLKGKGIKSIKDILKRIKNFNTLPIEELSKRGKALGKWGIGGAIAAALIYLGTKDDNKDGQSDLLTAVKTYIAPGSEPMLLEA